MEKRARILYVEDDTTLLYVTRDSLEMKGYSIDSCEDGMVALEWLNTRSYDLCILDVMLPKMDGFTLARKIREKNPEIPILFLTARSTREDRIHGLQQGGDDYITKPFSMEELVLKIEVFLRRSRIIVSTRGVSPERLVGKLMFDAANQVLYNGEHRQSLTYRESQLLAFLCAHSRQIVRREEILMAVWGNDHYFSSRSLDVFISRLRKHLKPDPAIRIENIHNVGYRLLVGGEGG